MLLLASSPVTLCLRLPKHEDPMKTAVQEEIAIGAGRLALPRPRGSILLGWDAAAS